MKEGMSFSTVMRGLKKGKAYQRAGWSKSGSFVVAARNGVGFDQDRRVIGDISGPFLLKKINKSDAFSLWKATPVDEGATDWREVA